MDLIKTMPDKQKAISLLETISIRLDLVQLMEKSDILKYASKIVEEYYESTLELITALMSIDGYKTRSDLTGAHIATINYLTATYKEFTQKETGIIDDLRQRRNGIKYYGKHVTPEYIKINEIQIKQIIEKLKSALNEKLSAA